MGNCQAVDTATLVIQYPNGKDERFHWPVAASEIMKMNPGHYVALLISTTLCPSNNKKSQDDENGNNNSKIRLTRIKLLRPADTLVLGQVYRLITTQEVMKGLKAKKQAKMKNYQLEAADKHERRHGEPGFGAARRPEAEENEMSRTERQKQRMAGSRTWQPSLQSISEAQLGAHNA